MLHVPIAAVLALLPAGGSDPFTDLPFEAAIERAGTESRLLLVDFTTRWDSGFQRRRDAWTWRDPVLMDWLQGEAIAIRLSLDEERLVAGPLGIGEPTIVALFDGQELDRIHAYRDAEGLLQWADEFKRRVEECRERAATLADSGDVNARHALARDLLHARQYDLALAHYLWLWPATRGTSMEGVRVSFMLSEMTELARQHEPARQAFTELLEALQTKLDARSPSEVADRREWLSMCDYFGQTQRVVAWYETQRGELERLPEWARDRVELLVGEHYATSAAPDPFTQLGFEAALQQARAQSRLLLVDFTTNWDKIDRSSNTVWHGPGVAAWLGEHGVGVRVVIEEERALAQGLAIEEPIVVAFFDGQELGRTKPRGSAELLAWADESKRRVEAARARAATLANSEDVDARYALVPELLEVKQHELALSSLLWLRPATREVSSMRGVRASFMLREMAQLAREHDPARTAFLDLLDEVQSRVDSAGLPELGDWKDWSSMCASFGRQERLIAWYEARRNERGRLFPKETSELVEEVVRDVYEALVAADRFQEASRLLGDVRRQADRIVWGHTSSAQTAGGDPQMEFARQRLIQDMSTLFAVLVAGDRMPEALDVAARLLKELDTPESRIGLVRVGLQAASRPEECFARWLDEAAPHAGAYSWPARSAAILRKKLAELGRR